MLTGPPLQQRQKAADRLHTKCHALSPTLAPPGPDAADKVNPWLPPPRVGAALRPPRRDIPPRFRPDQVRAICATAWGDGTGAELVCSGPSEIHQGASGDLPMATRILQEWSPLWLSALACPEGDLRGVPRRDLIHTRPACRVNRRRLIRMCRQWPSSPGSGGEPCCVPAVTCSTSGGGLIEQETPMRDLPPLVEALKPPTAAAIASDRRGVSAHPVKACPLEAVIQAARRLCKPGILNRTAWPGAASGHVGNASVPGVTKRRTGPQPCSAIRTFHRH